MSKLAQEAFSELQVQKTNPQELVKAALQLAVDGHQANKTRTELIKDGVDPQGLLHVVEAYLLELTNQKKIICSRNRCFTAASGKGSN